MPPRRREPSESAGTHSLTTPIPKALHLRMKLHCLAVDMLLREFIIEAIEERLQRGAPSERRR